MKIFLTGATGYIGSGVSTALLAAGHSITALVRDDLKAQQVQRAGVTPVVADMRDRDAVRRLAAQADAVIATASPGDDTSSAADTDFAEAVLDGLTTGRPFIRTGGVWVYGSSPEITERSPIDAPPIVSWRQALDERVLSRPDVRSLLIEPGIVYGHGGGIPNIVASAALTAGEPAALLLVGPGTQHWTTIHVDDLAELYVAALEHGESGSRYIGVSGDNPTTRELGEAASRRRGLHGRVTPEDGSATIARLGAFGEALLLDQQATGDKARMDLTWKPQRPSLLEEISMGGYDPV